MATRAAATAEDLFHVPDDGFRYELHRGALVREPLAGYGHGAVCNRLVHRLTVHVELRGLGQVVGADAGFILERNPDTVVAPDVAFLSRDRIEATGPVEGFWPSCPDLAVEVVSPGSSGPAMERRAALLLRAGTRLVWILDPKRRTATVYRPGAPPTVLDETGVLDGADVVPGFRCALRDVFDVWPRR